MAQSPVPRAAHRLDALDGLRTIAVFLVVLFHVAVPGMASGFIGVDVFFVLSGFLITSGLVREVQRSGRISLVRFWTRRLRRLMPAAMAVLLVVLVWSWTMAPAWRRQGLGGDLFHTVVYLANWHFMQAGSYFTADGTQSPLLHMWSLAVEEQFYLLWPLLLVGLMAWARRRTARAAVARGEEATREHFLGLSVLVTAGLTVLSAVLLAALFSPTAPDRAYMGTDSKAFEPLLGALLALLLTRPGVEELVRRHARALTWGGAAVMVLLFPFMQGPSRGYFDGGALVFCLATGALLLGSTRDADTVLARALSWGPMAYLGRISYGIYLWHWPLALALGTHAAFRPWRAIAVVLLTVALAALSYHFYEQPILTGRWSAWFTTFRTVGLAAAMMLLVSAAAAPLGGTVLTPLAREVLPKPPLNRSAIVMVGDSVPQRLMPSLAPAGQARGLTITAGTAGGCSPLGVLQKISPDDADGEKCPAVRKTQIDAVQAAGAATVVWWSRYEVADRYRGDALLSPPSKEFWAAQLDDFHQAVDRLTADGATLVVVLTEPPGRGMTSRCTATNCHPFLQRMVTHDEYRTQWNEIVRAEAAKDHRLRTVTMEDAICHTTPKPSSTWGSALCDDQVKGRPARPDGSHFDLPLVGTAISNALLDRVQAAVR